jgi:TfoX/Sxy family transcriptional regulator of competence genes
MFGGLAFLINGNMAVAASGQGGMMIRADPEKAAEFVKDGAQPMVMRGRQMKGWLRVEAPKSGSELTKWVKVGVGFASSLPPK